MSDRDNTSGGSEPQLTGPVPPASVSEFFLREDYEERGFRYMSKFVIVAIVLHVIVFMINFPEIKYTPQAERSERKVLKVRKYVPPPPKVERKQIQQKKLVKKVPVPDPTPDEPEPIIEPEPEIVVEDIPDDVDILIGDPEPPPQTGPLMAGVGGVTMPELIPGTRVEPEYPELARRARIEGKVFLQAVIRKDGTVGDIKVLKEPPGNLGFAEKAIAAVSQWRYKPATQNGRPVDVYMTVTVNFTLE
ncbi:MAG: hypothetical protein Kow0062_02710 [Acidobacteriota bacterium]|nr:MAG: energy transducer TonB [Acidobacteriota bacterium]